MPEPTTSPWNWETAAKVAVVATACTTLLKWFLTPMFAQAIRLALKPEIDALKKVSQQHPAILARLDAVEEELAEMRADLRAARSGAKP